LLAYIEILKQDAREDYRVQVLAYAMGGGEKPEIPKILSL
jgi:hypothetical protein